MTLAEALKSIEARLRGRKVTQEELVAMKGALDPRLVSDWYCDILETYALVGAQFSLAEGDDASDMGVELQWMTPKQSADESQETYPAIPAAKQGYVQVGTCLEGTGDPYFLRLGDSTDPPLVRILHDEVDDDTLTEHAVEIVTPTLVEFFSKATIE